MVLHRDFLMRSIERLVAVFLRVATQKDISEPEELQDEIEEAIGEVLGVAGPFALAQGPQAIETLEPAVAAEVARLLFVHARLSEKSGRDVRVAAELAVVALRRGLDPPFGEWTELAAEQLLEHADGLETLFGATNVSELFMAAFRWRSSQRDYAEAENWLFAAAEREPRHAAEGVAFYESALELMDHELERGGLPRDEVEESLHELRRLAADVT